MNQTDALKFKREQLLVELAALDAEITRRARSGDLLRTFQDICYDSQKNAFAQHAALSVPFVPKQ